MQLDDNPEGRKQSHWFSSVFIQVHEHIEEKEAFSGIPGLLTGTQVFIHFNPILHVSELQSQDH